MERKIKIILHGHLKDLYSKPIELMASSVYEAINGMCKLTKAFDVLPTQNKHVIKVVGFESEEEIKASLPMDVTELHIVPEMCGGKSGGFFKIAVAAVLIAASFLLPGSITGMSAIIKGVALKSVMLNLGISLALGGLLEILSPAPKIDQTGDSSSDPEASKYLGANQNTVKIGTRIPLLYGKEKAFGHYLSFNVDAKDIAL